MIDRLKITHLYTTPTVMMVLMKAGDEHVEKYTLSSLKVVALSEVLLITVVNVQLGSFPKPGQREQKAAL